MNYRTLGRTGIEVSEIGFGAWGLGGDAYGPVSDSVAVRTLHDAFDCGVTLYDTSDLYGAGRSEHLIGRALKSHRHQICIATKGGTLPHTGFDMPQDFSPEHLERALNDSLRRLRCDYVDIYQLHSPTMADLEANPEIVETLERFQRAGKIRTYGVSVRSPADGMRAIEQWDFPVVQVNFNLIDQRAVDCGLMAAVQQHRTGLISRTPLAFGYLSGKLTGDEPLGTLDHRSNWPADQLRRWADAPQKFAALNEGLSRTMVQLALQYCISHEAVATVIPGMTEPEHVRENTAASDKGPLTAAELSVARTIYQANDFFDSTAKSRGRA